MSDTTLPTMNDVYAALEMDAESITKETFQRLAGEDHQNGDLLTIDDLRMMATIATRLTVMAAIQVSDPTATKEALQNTITTINGLKQIFVGFTAGKGLITL